MKLSLEDILKRGFLFLCGVIFAIPTFILWKDTLVGNLWPDDFNGWVGLFMCPMFSLASFICALFYRRVEEVDSQLGDDMRRNTHRGKVIFTVLYTIMFLLPCIQAVESHLIKAEPVQTWEYIAFPLLTIIWIGSLIWVMKVDGEKCHKFLLKRGWRKIDAWLYNDFFDEEETP